MASLMSISSPGIYWDPREPPPPWIAHHQLPSDEHSISLKQIRPGKGFVAFAAHPITSRVPYENDSKVKISQPTAVSDISVEDHSSRPPSAPPVHKSSARRLPDSGFLPPLSASIKAQLVEDLAEVTMAQLFCNESDEITPKASYTFPLPQGCTVTSFLCRVGADKILKGVVKPKEEARRIFDDAVRRRRTAGLLDHHDPEIFTTTLGNIPARCRLKVEISFVHLLAYRFEDAHGLTTFTLPMHIASRFGSPSPDLQQALNASIGANNLALEVNILAAENITSVQCASHPISVEMGVGGTECQTWEQFVQAGQSEDPRSAHVQLRDTVNRLDRDLVLEIRTSPEKGLDLPQACVETHPEFENHRAVMVTIPSRFILKNVSQDGAQDASQPSHEIIFVADRSGSMEDKIFTLRSAMQFFLKGIPNDKRFNLWCFGSHFESLWPQSRPYSQESLAAALNYVQRYFKADMGGTALLPAIRAAVNARFPTNTTDIVVLTDGEVWDLDQTLRFVGKTRTTSQGKVRFFSLGIGHAVSHALVEGIARLGGGYAEVIPEASDGGWESRLVAVLKAMLTAHAELLDVEIDGLRDHPQASAASTAASSISPNHKDKSLMMMQSPVEAQSLSPFSRNRLFILFESLPPAVPISTVNIRVKRPQGDVVPIEVPVKALKRRKKTVHQLAARALLEDLERGTSQMHRPSNNMTRGSRLEAETVKAEGERLGCKWSLVSKWTSSVAVEETLDRSAERPDAFLDWRDDIAAPARDAGLDLLRPRGTNREALLGSAQGDKMIIDGIETAAEKVVPSAPTSPSIPESPEPSGENEFSSYSPTSIDLGGDQGYLSRGLATSRTPSPISPPSNYYDAGSMWHDSDASDHSDLERLASRPGTPEADLNLYKKATTHRDSGESAARKRRVVHHVPTRLSDVSDGPDSEEDRPLQTARARGWAPSSAQSAAVGKSVLARSRSLSWSPTRDAELASSVMASASRSIPEPKDGPRGSSAVERRRYRAVSKSTFNDSTMSSAGDKAQSAATVSFTRGSSPDWESDDLSAVENTLLADYRRKARRRNMPYSSAARATASPDEPGDDVVRELTLGSASRSYHDSGSDPDDNDRGTSVRGPPVSLSARCATLPRPRHVPTSVVEEEGSFRQSQSDKTGNGGPAIRSPRMIMQERQRRERDMRDRERRVPSIDGDARPLLVLHRSTRTTYRGPSSSRPPDHGNRQEISADESIPIRYLCAAYREPARSDTSALDCTNDLPAGLVRRTRTVRARGSHPQRPVIQDGEAEPPTAAASQQALVKKLLDRQLHDGSFNVPEDMLPTLLGVESYSALFGLETLVMQHCALWDSPEVSKLVVTCAVVALLEVQVASLAELWELMVVKARDFIRGYCQDPGVLIAEAKKCHAVAGTDSVPSVVDRQPYDFY